ncbi:Uncharacterised protein [Achromobacter denitrificans]|uniref:hypothetical protein n=1 Tax=Achromobacter denitrificans TaxID=32002 RepID=UPI000966D00E|nr:hypothetical protein [Achromobacter denitrificans]OLU09807.1 hypothetical protein BVK87_03430 [Achromobacter denitrificans]QKH43753.1 hypothetical protein FOC82_20740 [Achromobacter denitrificans]QKH49106.1 hypothetical protein FOC80_06410 [Achromobacter denitrificans]CAB3688624.1 hypothetical protein LMG1231_01957 [Achromobacter denitrificans]SUU11069.1 Uncharacterised protein [Achromobacter denitrificans]
MRRFFDSPAYRWFLLCCAYVVIAAAVINGFYTKWRLNDGHPALGLSQMVEGTAHRPYVYRQFVPAVVNGIQGLLPEATVARLSERLAEPRRLNSRSGLAMRYPGSEALVPAVTLRYHLVFYLTFFALLAALFVMRRVGLAVGADPAAATMAPAVLALLLPFFLTEGGYFYDFFELLFMMSAALLAMGASPGKPLRLIALLALAGFATWNKEAFFFFTPALYPLLRRNLPRAQAAAVAAALLFVCGCVYLALRMRYAGNPGTTVDYQLWDNLRFYVDPGNWLRTESTYGVLLPRGFGVVSMLAFAGIAVCGWARLPQAWRQHAQLALAINLPLFVLFCSPGEMRNLSMLYPTLLGLTALALGLWLKPQPEAGRPAVERAR